MKHMSGASRAAREGGGELGFYVGKPPSRLHARLRGTQLGTAPSSAPCLAGKNVSFAAKSSTSKDFQTYFQVTCMRHRMEDSGHDKSGRKSAGPAVGAFLGVCMHALKSSFLAVLTVRDPRQHLGRDLQPHRPRWGAAPAGNSETAAAHSLVQSRSRSQASEALHRLPPGRTRHTP